MTNNRRIDQSQQRNGDIEKIMGKARCQSALSDEVRNAMQTSLMKRDEKQTATPGGIAVSEICYSQSPLRITPTASPSMVKLC